MQNLIRRGNTLFARFFIPRDRWQDAGKALGAPAGIKREIVRTLGTTDIKEARRRLGTALAAIQTDLDASLRAAGLRPITDWTADWQGRARELRAELQSAEAAQVVSTVTVEQPDGTTIEVVDTAGDFIREQARAEAEQLEQARGYAVADAFYTAVTTEHTTIQEGLDAWLAEAGRRVKPKTIAGHRAVFANLEAFLRQKRVGQSLTALSFGDVSRRLAGEFIMHRLVHVSAAAVKREASAPMGLWRWAIRRGHGEVNPWEDQTAGLEDARKDTAEDAKRPFEPAELVTLLRAGGAQWAPNRGGCGATLWDAVRLALLTGLRVAELADLRVRDLAEDNTVIVVPRGKTSNAARRIPLPQIAQKVLALRLADLPSGLPDAPLWPELPVLKLTASRGGKLSDKFRPARARLLPDASGVDFHSLRRSYATALEAAMHKERRINPAVIASLMGHARGTLALDLYSGGAGLDALRNAVADLEQHGVDPAVMKALAETLDQRPRMVRLAPARGQQDVSQSSPSQRRRAALRPASPRPSVAAIDVPTDTSDSLRPSASSASTSGPPA